MGVVLVAFGATGAAPFARSHAQGRPTLTIELPADSLLTRRGPVVQAVNMLAGERIQNLLLAGFPARFQFRVELWSDRFFDALEDAAEFDVFAQFLPVEKVYEVIQVQDERKLSLGKFASVADAQRAIGRPTLAALAAARSTRAQYYHATLLVEVLSEKDLDEVGRWLRGDIEPGITGRANPASILTRGIRTIASRLLGGEKLEYEATSARFRVP